MKFQVIPRYWLSSPPLPRKVVHLAHNTVSLFSLKCKGLACWPGEEESEEILAGVGCDFSFLGIGSSSSFDFQCSRGLLTQFKELGVLF